jgi:hypothetical protein
MVEPSHLKGHDSQNIVGANKNRDLLRIRFDYLQKTLKSVAGEITSDPKIAQYKSFVSKPVLQSADPIEGLAFTCRAN